MPKTSSPYNLDVEMERFERILVNVAAYGRERMPFGGRLMIEVSAVVVDRTFVEKYPNVRPGAHVLLTVTEKKGATGPDWSTTVRDQASGANGQRAANTEARCRPRCAAGARQRLWRPPVDHGGAERQHGASDSLASPGAGRSRAGKEGGSRTLDEQAGGRAKLADETV